MPLTVATPLAGLLPPPDPFRDTSTVLYGRAAELGRIERLLGAARAGFSAALLFRGEPGVGKTTLLTEADRRAVADGMTVLRVRGVESEAELAFAGLSTVLAPILDLVGVLPPLQADALNGALALGRAAAHPLAVGAATLGVLAAAAERRPVLVVVDDVHWLDEPSAGALLFAARRLDADPVALLLATRSGESSPFDGTGIEEELVTGLDRVTACTLLETAGPTVVPAVADRLHALTDGNPLALIHVATLLDDEQRLGRTPLDEPLPIGLELQRALHRQLVGLPEVTRQALTVVAAEPTGDLAVVDAALTTIGREIADLDAAAAADFIGIVPGHIEFRHPLMRAACYHEAPPTQRRRAHAALAYACVRVGADPGREQQAWHLAAATAGPDEQAARLLDEVSEVTRRRGALTTAAGVSSGRPAYRPTLRTGADGSRRQLRPSGCVATWTRPCLCSTRSWQPRTTQSCEPTQPRSGGRPRPGGLAPAAATRYLLLKPRPWRPTTLTAPRACSPMP